MRYFYLLIILCLGAGTSATLGINQSCGLRAQDLKLELTAVDVSTSDRLSFVSGQLAPGGASGTTDDKGNLTLRLKPARYTIRASFTGFAPYEKTLLLSDSRKFTVRMEPTATDL